MLLAAFVVVALALLFSCPYPPVVSVDVTLVACANEILPSLKTSAFTLKATASISSSVDGADVDTNDL